MVIICEPLLGIQLHEILILSDATAWDQEIVLLIGSSLSLDVCSSRNPQVENLYSIIFRQ